ncbi:MAG TPA: hypothetical protein VGR35_12735 [Tepidisphaeraceae bacterium]|nr:hypothetical protein [Tepidisphaeraceae bacterium]
MTYYRLCLLDQPKSSWVLHDVIKRVPKRKNPEMPSAFYKFFAPPDADVHMKERYQPLCCPKCGRYESDEVFDAGFEEPMAIRFKQDMAWTDDRQLVLSDKVLKVLKAAKVGGYETKPIGKSGWHVMRVTSRVECNKKAYNLEKPNCKACGQPDEGGGSIWQLRDIKPPAGTNMFFTTKVGWPSMYMADREVFLTEDVFAALKEGKVSGPHCERLLTDDEVAKMKATGKEPAGRTVYLKGK